MPFRRLRIASAIVATLGITACQSQNAFAPTDSSPSGSRVGNGAQTSSRHSRPSGELHVVKDCSDYTGHAGEICTIFDSA